MAKTCAWHIYTSAINMKEGHHFKVDTSMGYSTMRPTASFGTVFVPTWPEFRRLEGVAMPFPINLESLLAAGYAF